MGGVDSAAMNDLGTKLERASTLNERASLFQLNTRSKFSQFSETSHSMNADKMFSMGSRNSLTGRQSVSFASGCLKLLDSPVANLYIAVILKHVKSALVNDRLFTLTISQDNSLI